MILRRASFYLRYMSEHDQQPFTVEGTVKLDAAAAAAHAEAEAASMLVPLSNRISPFRYPVSRDGPDRNRSSMARRPSR